MEARSIYSTAFILRKAKDNEKEALIYCRITVNKQRAEFSIKKKVRKSIWNNGQAKTTSEEGRSINAYLKQVETALFQYYHEMRAERKFISAEELKNVYLGLGEVEEHSLLELVGYHDTQMKSTLRPGILKNYFTTQKYLQCFLKEVFRKKRCLPL